MRNAICTAVLLGVLGPAVSLAADDDLVGYWRFTTAAGPVADLSGHGHTAQLSGGKIVMDDGRPVLALDGRQEIRVPSSPELNLQRAFSIVAKVKIVAPAESRAIVYKQDQYLLRVDHREETGRISFFPYTDGEWEPRVSSLPPALGQWCHVVATWDGRQSFLWLNEMPFSTLRGGKLPPASDAPLLIASASAPGGGIHGAIEYVKIYRKALTPKEIMIDAFGAEANVAPSDATDFDFSAQAGIGAWAPLQGAATALADGRLAVTTKSPNSLVINRRLNANIDKKDFVSLRMSVDRGNQAKLVFEVHDLWPLTPVNNAVPERN